MNNNRNNRRRGRGNRNTQSAGGGNQLNRIDSRARGNAPQLLDKYKKLAQDAQHNGDRVQAEYFLQFADHYFRVIADNKARQDEARAKRTDGRGDSRDQVNDDSDDGDDGDSRDNRRSESNRKEGRNEGRNESRGDSRRGNNRKPRGRRDEQSDGEYMNAVDEGPAEGRPGVEGEAASPEEEAPKPKRRARKPKSDDAGEAPRRKPRASRAKAKDTDESSNGLDSSVLPPAIGGAGKDSDDTLEAVG